MSRSTRPSPGGLAYHVMNRYVAGLTRFEGDGDYAAFERVMGGGEASFSSTDHPSQYAARHPNWAGWDKLCDCPLTDAQVPAIRRDNASRIIHIR